MTVDCHNLCIWCRGYACVPDNRYGEYMEWPEEVFPLYAPYRISPTSLIRSKFSAPPPPAASVSSPLPSPHADIVSRFSFFECYGSYLS